MPLLYEAVARIALDIDSTLHHYWDLLQRIAHERYGVDLPYEEQRDWGITVLERDAIVHCVEETHSDENIAAGVPYPDAVETVRELARAGALDPRDEPPPHAAPTRPPRRGSTGSACPGTTSTARSTRCPRCVELGIDVLVDDSPVNIAKARAEGIVPATIIHPWNEEIVEADGVIGGARLARPQGRRSTRCWNASTPAPA